MVDLVVTVSIRVVVLAPGPVRAVVTEAEVMTMEEEAGAVCQTCLPQECLLKHEQITIAIPVEVAASGTQLRGKLTKNMTLETMTSWPLAGRIPSLLQLPLGPVVHRLCLLLLVLQVLLLRHLRLHQRLYLTCLAWTTISLNPPRRLHNPPPTRHYLP